MKIGLFDHIEDDGRPLSTLFDERLTFIKAADDAGLYCLHLAEHHATPLNMVPVPGVFLGAVARATKRMRLGPLVYLLPLYSPLRLIEEIAMLDHMSLGRLDVGVGRGVSPYELKYHKVEHDDSRDIFIDAFDCLTAGLTSDTLNYEGPHYKYKDVPIAMRPLQQPHPPFWYASSNTIGSTWGGEHGLHFVTLGPMATAKTNINAFKEAFAKRGRAAQPKAEFPGGVVVGVQRHVFVADTDEEAKRFAKPAMDLHLEESELAAREARRDRRLFARHAPQRAARRDLRGVRRRRHGDLRQSRARSRRDRAAGRRARRQLFPDVPVPRLDVARAGAALAQPVQHRSDAEAGEVVKPCPSPARGRTASAASQVGVSSRAG